MVSRLEKNVILFDPLSVFEARRRRDSASWFSLPSLFGSSKSGSPAMTREDVFDIMRVLDPLPDDVEMKLTLESSDRACIDSISEHVCKQVKRLDYAAIDQLFKQIEHLKLVAEANIAEAAWQTFEASLKELQRSLLMKNGRQVVCRPASAPQSAPALQLAAPEPRPRGAPGPGGNAYKADCARSR